MEALAPAILAVPVVPLCMSAYLKFLLVLLYLLLLVAVW